jgi:pimeloyl-ACP methyl ester carboxylesterase
LAANVLKFRPVIVDYCARWFVAKQNRERVSEYLFEQFYRGIMGFAWQHKVIIPSVFSDEELRSIQVSVLLMVGDQEVIYDYERVLSRAKLCIPHMDTRVAAGSGHAISIERAEEINAGF